MRIEQLQQALTTLGYNRMIATYDGSLKTWTVRIEKTQGAINSFGGCATDNSIEAAIRTALKCEGIHLPDEPPGDAPRMTLRDTAILRALIADVGNAATIATLARDGLRDLIGDLR